MLGVEGALFSTNLFLLVDSFLPTFIIRLQQKDPPCLILKVVVLGLCGGVFGSRGGAAGPAPMRSC